MRRVGPSPVVLIPSINPPHGLINFVEHLKTFFEHIVVVDDGSDGSHRYVFETLRGRGVCVLRHDKNKGKGHALKTGLGYVVDHFAGRAVITADSDGQHEVGDIVSIGKVLDGQGDQCLVLGERDFRGRGIPLCSKIGNRMVSLLVGVIWPSWGRGSDTQTGLRGIGQGLVEECLEIRGKGYEYEMNLLFHYLEKKSPVLKVPIKTIYQGIDRSSHFRKGVDSYLICCVIARQYRKQLKGLLSKILHPDKVLERPLK